MFIAGELLSAEGFTVQYVQGDLSVDNSMWLAGGETDFDLNMPAMLIKLMDAGVPIKVRTGLHTGCFEVIANGDTLNTKLATKDNRLAQLLGSGKPDAQLIEEAYFLTLSRPPSETEKAGMLKLLTGATTPEDRRTALEDAFWSLMSAREFFFNH